MCPVTTTGDDPLHPFGRVHDDPARCCCRQYTPIRHHPECPRPEPIEVCWHCRIVLMPEPLPHCECCPAFGDCDVLGCDEPGCNETIDDAIVELQRAAGAVEDELRVRLCRAHELLRRVVDDGLDAASLQALARDIATELYDHPLDPAAASTDN